MLHLTRSTSEESRILGHTLLKITFVVASLLLALRPTSAAATTFVVDSTADYGDQSPGDGTCDTGTIMLVGESYTLRAAIQEANAASGAEVIDFNIDGTGVSTIAPTYELPKISRTLTINGYSLELRQTPGR
jgi:hypothetical protein